MLFTKPARANYYDCDGNNLLKISAAMRYMQQTSSEHLESLNISPVMLYRRNMVFLLSKMCIKVHRMPLVSEELQIGTAPTEIKGPRFVREFIIDSLEGERLLSALSLWVLVNPETRKILRPASFPYHLQMSESMIDGAIGDVRFPKLLEAAGGEGLRIRVGYSHLDTNKHVNNSVYADFVCDALPYESLMASGLDTLVVGFQNEARHGDNLEVATNRITEKEFYISGTHGRGACFEAVALLK